MLTRSWHHDLRYPARPAGNPASSPRPRKPHQNTTTQNCPGGFYRACTHFGVIICIAAPLFAAADYAESRTIVEWRRWLTQRLLRSYFGNRSYYALKQYGSGVVDNPDQVRDACGWHVMNTPVLHMRAWQSEGEVEVGVREAAAVPARGRNAVVLADAMEQSALQQIGLEMRPCHL